MIEIYTELVQALETVLPTHYEMTLHSGLETPCISWMETNNYVSSIGDTLGYYVVQVQIKVWCNDIELIHRYSKEIEDVLRPLDWKRTASGELYDNNSSMIQKILTYETFTRRDFGG